MSEPIADDSESVFDVEDASTYDRNVWVVHRCLECWALVLAEDTAQHFAWHHRIQGGPR